MAASSTDAVQAYVEKEWDATIVPALTEYIKIPNQSPLFDPECLSNGLMEKATKLMTDWVDTQKVPGLKMEVLQNEGMTPLIYMEVAATDPDAGTVLLYGHLDKQPPFEGWVPPWAPYDPVMTKDGKLYGRGGADDGYAIFAAIAALKGLKISGKSHGRAVIIIEACEESGSPDLPTYIEMLKPRIGSPDLVVCLDSGCGNYDQLWVTTSLRGIVAGTLRVSITTEGVHSGDSSGVIPDTFRIARKLLDRVDDSGTGVVKVPELNCDIPEARVKQTKVAAGILGDKIHTDFPFLPGAKPASESLVELALNRTWRPTLTVTGAAGLPPLAQAGNVLRPTTALMLSVRIPPAVDPKMAQAALKVTLEADPPYGATVVFDSSKAGPGWESPALAPWLEAAAAKASATYYGKPAVYYGEGGSIPFMGMLGNLFPASQFLIVGVLGPASNAHGPNEFLHVPYAKKLTCVVASVLADHCKLRLGGAGGVAAAADACVHPAKRLKTDFGRDSEGKKI